MKDQQALELEHNVEGLKQFIFRIFGARQVGGLDTERLRALVGSIMTARPDEIGCAECSEHMARFADMVMAGALAASIMPLVQDHLARCRDCREEYEALLEAVGSTA